MKNENTAEKGTTLLKLFILLTVVSGIAEGIGMVVIPLGSIGKIVVLPMIFAMIFAVLFTPDALGRVVSSLKNFCGEKEVKASEEVVMLILLILGVKLGTSAGPNIIKLIESGSSSSFTRIWKSRNNVIRITICNITWNEKRSCWGDSKYL